MVEAAWIDKPRAAVEEFSMPFDMMLQQESVKHLSSGVSKKVDSLSTLAKIKYIVKLANTSYHSFCTSGAFNVTTASFNHCFDCDAPNHGIGSCPHKKDQKSIAENKKKLIKMKQIQGGNGGGKMWAKQSNKKVGLIKTKRRKKINKKEMEILRVTTGFTLLTASECASVTRVVGLIPHIPLASMIHETPVCKTINPSTFLIPMSFKIKR